MTQSKLGTRWWPWADVSAPVALSTAVAVTLIAMHAAVSWSLYVNHALVPDEIMFLNAVYPPDGGATLSYLLGSDNQYGYGSLYWFYHKLFDMTADPDITARTFFWFALVGSNLLLLAACARLAPRGAALAILFSLTLPMAWWQGKITGPETLSHFFAILSVALALWLPRRWRFIGAGLALGLAIGVKLSALPMGALVGALLLHDRPRDMRLTALAAPLAWFAAAIVAGFIVANPFVLWAPDKLFSDFYLMKDESGRHPLERLMVGKGGYFWESVPVGSFAYFGAPLIVAGLICALAALAPGRRLIVAAWIVSLVGAIILISRTPAFWGWYFYTQIMTLPLLFAIMVSGDRASSPGPRWRALLHAPVVAAGCVFCVITAAANTEAVAHMVGRKFAHVAQMEKLPAIRARADLLIAKHKPGLLVDFNEFNTALFEPGRAEELGARMKLIATQERRKSDAIGFLWPFTHNHDIDERGHVRACGQLEGQNTVLIIAGQRIVPSEYWHDDFHDWVRNAIVSACPGWAIATYQYEENTHFVVLRRIIDVNETTPFPVTVNASPTFAKEAAERKEDLSQGVIVGPGPVAANVFAQRVDVNPLTLYKVRAIAAAEGAPAATGRLQINWLAENDRFVSSSLRVIALTPEATTAEFVTFSPDDAVTAMLYVTPHGDADVVRFREMRLLKGPSAPPEARLP